MVNGMRLSKVRPILGPFQIGQHNLFTLLVMVSFAILVLQLDIQPKIVMVSKKILFLFNLIFLFKGITSTLAMEA